MKNSSHQRPCLALSRILILALALSSGLVAHAQLVADGASYILDGASVNLGTTNLTVGTNGPNTTLVITNGGIVSESAQGFIGYNASANINQASVSSPGSTWNSSAELYVGYSGPFNTLLITDGGSVSNAARGAIGFNSSAFDNQVIVSDPGSRWDNGAELYVGDSGPYNRLLITNGGSVSNAARGAIGFNAGAFKNEVIVSDPGSTWDNGSGLSVGYSGSYNTLLVTNGGTVNSTFGLIGFQGANFLSGDFRGGNNRVVVTGTNSVWNTGASLFVGQVSTFNSLLIEDGGTVNSGPSTCYIGWDGTADNNQVIVDGPGSAWTTEYRFVVGNGGSFNALLIANGGTVRSVGPIDVGSFGDNNEVAVSGSDSSWTNNGPITIGQGPSSFNTLRITDGAKVSNTSCFIGASSGGNNQAIVSGTNSMWKNSSVLDVGGFGSSNSLLIADGGSVQALRATVGGRLSHPDNVLALSNGTLTVPGGLLISSNNNTLTGSGTINGIVTDRGTIAPGASVGTIVLTDPPVLLGLVVMEISRNGAALTNDQIQVTGELAYGGSLTVTDIGMDAPALGDSFQLFSASGGYSGGFDSISLPPLPSGLGWTNHLLINGSMAVVSQPTLNIGDPIQSGTNLIFTVTGGSPGGTWTQLTATNVALPIASWATNRFGNFDGLGSVSLTNGVNVAEPQRYYRISTP